MYARRHNVLECERAWVSGSTCLRLKKSAPIVNSSRPCWALLRTHRQARRETSKVKYVPCPECSQLMNRINFARCSGVIVDICKQHGTWFDRDELSRIVEFIRGGGLNASRAKEKMEIAEERERLRQEQLACDAQRSARLGIGGVDDHRLSGIASARGLLKFLLD